MINNRAQILHDRSNDVVTNTINGMAPKLDFKFGERFRGSLRIMPATISILVLAFPRILSPLACWEAVLTEPFSIKDDRELTCPCSTVAREIFSVVSGALNTSGSQAPVALLRSNGAVNPMVNFHFHLDGADF